MKILLVEDELYLAHAIATKLESLGYSCTSTLSIDEALKIEKKDILIISTSSTSPKFYALLKEYKNSVVILLANYISNDTITRPIAIGANDYVVKPFSIEELVRKLNHCVEFNRLKKLNDAMKAHIRCTQFKIEINPVNINLPIFVQTSSVNRAFSFVFDIANQKKLGIIYLEFLDFSSDMKCLTSATKKDLVFISGFDFLTKGCRDEVLEAIRNKNIVIYTNAEPAKNFNILKLNTQIESSGGEILSVENYIKHIILFNQNNLSDTELAKRLGMSRKSLWEKRKKYGISKK